MDTEIVRRLRSALRVAVLTGAGVSAESGVATFRQAQTGLWAQYRPEDLATPEAFRRDPQRVWAWYQQRREKVAAVVPNPGHYALAEIERQVAARGGQFTLITQNVDGLHRRAGSQNVLELHGNLARVKCADENRVVESWPAGGEIPPHCPRCGGLLRPDVVWFGEEMPLWELGMALEAARACELFFSVGASTLVQPAASLPFIALENGAFVVEINLEATPLTPSASAVLTGRSGEVLPALAAAAFA